MKNPWQVEKVAPDQRLGAQVVEMSKLLESLGVWLIT
jgi:hypothetical protein